MFSQWTAPEALLHLTFSSRSDVWSFGVVLWELATHGAAPFFGVDHHFVVLRLERGLRLPRPEGCPAAVYALMRDTWAWDPLKRPSFAGVVARLDTLYADGSLNEAVAQVAELDRRSRADFDNVVIQVPVVPAVPAVPVPPSVSAAPIPAPRPADVTSYSNKVG